MTDLDLVRTIGTADHRLAVLVTHHPDWPGPDIAVVNAAPIDHPVHGRPVVAIIGRRGAPRYLPVFAPGLLRTVPSVCP